MGEVLSQNEIDSLLAALSSGEIDAEEMSDASDKQVKNMTLSVRPSFQRSTCVHWRSYMSITAGYYLPAFRYISERVYRSR